jgi:hypothetical protein
MKKIYLSLILSVVIIQSATAQWTSSGGISSNPEIIKIGDISTSYTPTSGNLGNLILNSQDYSTIAFHHSGNRVDFIRAGNGTIQLGYDGGWGMPNIGLPNGIWTAAGFVGIANSTPKLQLQVGNSTGVQTALGVYSEFTANHYFDGSSWRYINDGYGSFIEMNSLDGSINFRNSPSGTAGATSNPVSRMFIDNIGRVGIGTSSPGFLLDIKNTGATTPGISIGNGTGNFLLGVGITAANANEFGIYDINAGKARFTLNSNGYVGIGTGSATPGYLLTLSGTNPQLSLLNSTAGNETSIMFNTNVANKADWFLGQNEGGIGTGNFGLYTTMFGQAITVLGNNGNVGIGTNIPSAPLTVSRSGATAGADYSALHIETTGSGNIYGPVLYLNGTSGTNGRMWGLISSGALDAGGTGAAGNFAIYDTNAGSRLVINSLGQVGIGTISPGYKLDVSGMGNFAGVNLTAQSTVVPGVDIAYGTIATGKYVGQYFQSADQQMHFYNGTGGADILQLNQNNNNVSIPNGYLGIGTPSPRTKLDFGNASSFPADIIGLYDGGANVQYGVGLNLAGGNDGTGGLTLYSGDRGIVFRNHNINGTELMSVTNSGNFSVMGNVGIGTTDNAAWQLATSTYKLAVEGKIITEEVTVKLRANWPDYVFNPKYTLMPLTDVKSYIDKNHHLPDMPTAAQVEKDGLNLGEMNKLLLKKVEELTLYLIEKDKNEQQQKVVNSDLQTQIADQNLHLIEKDKSEQQQKVINSNLQTQIADQNNKIAKLEKQLELILKKSQ